MYAVSNAWAAANSELLAPEGFVEISCYIPELNETLVYTKSDLMSFTHQQTGSLVAGELPKNHIEFSLDNSDGRWDPSNPSGLEAYLSERLKITLRYGMDIDGVTEWIPGGVFYLSEWSTSANSNEATFVARDLLEYMMEKPFTLGISGNLLQIAENAIWQAQIPDDAVVNLCSELADYTAEIPEYDGTTTIAEVLQKCVNAAGCVMYQDRDGVLNIVKRTKEDTGYVIPRMLCYTYPEITLSRPLKSVSVSYYGSASVQWLFSGSGETQSLTNDFIQTAAQATEVAQGVCECLRTRMRIRGEFRGDPRFDLFDVVQVETKDGTIGTVVLTDIKYSFTGAFRVSYSGYIYGSTTAAYVYSGEVYAGEVV